MILTAIIRSKSKGMHFDFCSGYAPDCELKEHCPCLEIWNEEEDDNMGIDLKEG